MSNDFEPIFIVGNPRSGTTLLATLLSRHSEIAIPSETQFFRKVLRCGVVPIRQKRTHEELCDIQFSYFRTKDLNLDKDEFCKYFHRYEPTFSNLFRALLEFYATSVGKVRSGEKSPVHLFYVPEILKWYPEAKIICIVRDGRDAVLSLMKVPWGHNNIKRHCAEWCHYSKLTLRYKKRYSDSICIIRYEDLLSLPEKTIDNLSSFLGLKLDADLLLTEQDSDVVANWESDWKNNANRQLDYSRAYAWKKYDNKNELKMMNAIMRKYLSLFGYEVCQSVPYNMFENIVSFAKLIPYTQNIYFIHRSVRELVKKIACLLRLKEIENENVRS